MLIASTLVLHRVVLLAALLLLASVAFGQQAYVARYDAFVGYGFLDSPHINLFENGFAAQVGFRPKTWYSVGFDYTMATGDLNLTPDLLPTDLQQSLGSQLGQLIGAGLLPKTYSLVVPAHSRTQTFAVGPQLAYRRLTHATLFLRPVYAGAIHESATPKAPTGDFFAAGVIQKLAPSGKKTDVTWFLGFGGGFDILMSKHFAWRVQADLVYDHLFNDLLRDGRFTTRFSVGPAFNFGRNIKE
ncbi:MAG TPA: hypothetical protein VGH38_06015 [Bryobacteraceae bacterium]